jgi:DNA-binding NtrC family response regulator
MPHRKEDAVGSVATKVLVVDDDPDLQEILGICLRNWGFEVASAANGNDGARLAESYHPDIVLSDVMMPDISGIDLLKSLLSKEPGRPVILMTGYSTSDIVAAAIKDGALDLLTKPLDYRKLKSILETSQRDLKSPNQSRDFHSN